MGVSAGTHQLVAMEDPDRLWELVCGRLRHKPEMTTEHNQVARALVRRLLVQLPEREYAVTERAHLRIPGGSSFNPDVCVIPRAAIEQLARRPGTFEVYDSPMPLVVEVWSPKTGEYDVSEKLREEQARGDAEIWRLHPYEKTLTAWQRQPDGRYTERHVSEGVVQPAALPGVTIVLAEVFA